jgi:hypothetical protein
MKKYLLILTLVLSLSIQLFSQEGKIFIGGSFGFNDQTNSTSASGISVKGPTNYSFSILPSAGYYLDDKLAVGSSIGLTISGTHENDATNTTLSATTFSIAPFIWYHLLEINNLSIIGQASFGLSFGSSSTTTNGISTGPSISPGLSYKMSDKVSIQAFIGNFGYTYSSSSQSGVKTSNNNLNLSLSSGLSLGFIIFL